MCLAALELAYVFNGIAHAPRDVVVEKMLPQTKAELDKLNNYQDKPKEWCNGKANYWDDYCLCRFLEGVCERYLAYQVCFEVLQPRMALKLYYRILLLHQKMMLRIGSTTRNARKMLSRQFYRRERRSERTIISFSTLVHPFRFLHPHQKY